MKMSVYRRTFKSNFGAAWIMNFNKFKLSLSPLMTVYNTAIHPMLKFLSKKVKAWNNIQKFTVIG